MAGEDRRAWLWALGAGAGVCRRLVAGGGLTLTVSSLDPQEPRLCGVRKERFVGFRSGGRAPREETLYEVTFDRKFLFCFCFTQYQYNTSIMR